MEELEPDYDEAEEDYNPGPGEQQNWQAGRNHRTSAGLKVRAFKGTSLGATLLGVTG